MNKATEQFCFVRVATKIPMHDLLARNRVLCATCYVHVHCCSIITDAEVKEIFTAVKNMQCFIKQYKIV